MKFPATALFTTVLFIASLSPLAIPTVNVAVTNFPLDAGGNLRVTQMNQDQNVTIINLPLDEQGNLRIKMAEEPLQTYKDVVKIDVLGWVAREWAYSGESKEWGIYVRDNYPAELAFAFSPKPNLSSITNIVVVIYATGSSYNFNLNINGNNIPLGTVLFPIDIPSAKRIQLDPNTVQINTGINLLRMSGTVDYLSVYEVTVFVEYEYQA